MKVSINNYYLININYLERFREICPEILDGLPIIYVESVRYFTDSKEWAIGFVAAAGDKRYEHRYKADKVFDNFFVPLAEVYFYCDRESGEQIYRPISINNNKILAAFSYFKDVRYKDYFWHDSFLDKNWKYIEYGGNKYSVKDLGL